MNLLITIVQKIFLLRLLCDREKNNSNNNEGGQSEKHSHDTETKKKEYPQSSSNKMSESGMVNTSKRSLLDYAIHVCLSCDLPARFEESTYK